MLFLFHTHFGCVDLDKSIFIDSQSLCLNGITKCRFIATYKKETSQVIGCLSKSSQTV